MFKYLFFVACILVSVKLNATNDLIVKDPNGLLHYRIDVESKILYREQQDGSWFYLGLLKFTNVELREFRIFSNQSFTNKGKILISVEGTGQLFELDIKNLRFSSLIKTYFRGHNFSSIKYMRKDTLFSIGGSGFWHINNLETFFSNQTHEWDLLSPPRDENPQQILKQFGGYDRTRDIISVIESPPFYHKANKEFPYRYFEKSIHSNRWKLVGDINTSLLFKLGLKSLNSIFLNGIFLFSDGDLIVFADPGMNKVFLVEKNIPLFSDLNELSENNGYLYSYFRDNNLKKNGIKIDSISIEKLKSMGIPQGDFYLKNHIPLPFYFILAVLVVTGLYFLWKKSTNNMKGMTKKKIEHLQLDVLPEGSIEFLKIYLSYPLGHEFDTNKMTELMGYNNYTPETQRQVRTKMINGINQYFKFYHQMDMVILRKNSKVDKRMSLYYLAEKHYHALKTLLDS